jgi:hypothetical protein
MWDVFAYPQGYVYPTLHTTVRMLGSLLRVSFETLMCAFILYFCTSWLLGVVRVFTYPISIRQTHIHPFTYTYIIYIIYKIILLYMYIVICVPSLVEIAPGVPELCRNMHTHKHTYSHYIYIYSICNIYIYSHMCTKFGWNCSRCSRAMLEHTYKNIHSFLFLYA